MSGRMISYSYTPRNAISEVTENAGSTTYSYDGDGHVTGETLPNGFTVTNAYNSDG